MAQIERNSLHLKLTLLIKQKIKDKDLSQRFLLVYCLTTIGSSVPIDFQKNVLIERFL